MERPWVSSQRDQGLESQFLRFYGQITLTLSLGFLTENGADSTYFLRLSERVNDCDEGMKVSKTVPGRRYKGLLRYLVLFWLLSFHLLFLSSADDSPTLFSLTCDNMHIEKQTLSRKAKGSQVVPVHTRYSPSPLGESIATLN